MYPKSWAGCACWHRSWARLTELHLSALLLLYIKNIYPYAGDIGGHILARGRWYALRSFHVSLISQSVPWKRESRDAAGAANNKFGASHEKREELSIIDVMERRTAYWSFSLVLIMFSHSKHHVESFGVTIWLGGILWRRRNLCRRGY